MRKYKSLTIPDRRLRRDNNIIEKQENYCHKSACHKECMSCLFCIDNISEFKEWYLSKNKRTKS